MEQLSLVRFGTRGRSGI